MARNLERELARLSRTVRRKVALRHPPDTLSGPVNLSAADRLALIWDKTRAGLLRWLRRR